MEGLVFITQKRDGRIKATLAYNGNPIWEWIFQEDKISSKEFTESIMLACAIGDMEGGVVISQDVPNTFFRTSFPSDPSGKICISRIQGLIVDWLVDMNPSTYKGKVLCKKGQKVLYLEVLKAIYLMLVVT